jgi:hypothetical protein
MKVIFVSVVFINGKRLAIANVEKNISCIQEDCIINARNCYLNKIKVQFYRKNLNKKEIRNKKLLLKFNWCCFL